MVSQKGVCTQWRDKGSCSRGDRCPWVTTHTSDNRLMTRSPKGKGKGKDDGKAGKSANTWGNRNQETADANRPNRNSTMPHSKDEAFQRHGEAFIEASRFDNEDNRVYPKKLRGKSPSGKNRVEQCTQWMKGECATGANCDF